MGWVKWKEGGKRGVGKRGKRVKKGSFCNQFAVTLSKGYCNHVVCRGVLVCVIRDATEKAEYQGKRRARGYAVNGGEFEYRRHLSSFRRQRRRPS